MQPEDQLEGQMQAEVKPLYSHLQHAVATTYCIALIIVPLMVIVWFLVMDSNIASQLPISWILGVTMARALLLLAPIVKNDPATCEVFFTYIVFQGVWMFYGFWIASITRPDRNIPTLCYKINFWSLYVDVAFTLFSYYNPQTRG